MKKLLLMCCFLIGITAVSRAQGGTMKMSPDDRAKLLQTTLKLSDDQTVKIKAIFTAQQTKMDSVRTASNGDRDAMRQGMMPIRTATNNQIKAILTPDQATAYQKLMDEMRAKMQQQNGGGGGN
jgi:protein CpxP